MSKKGFTVVELMITVAIIGIMSAIAFPSLMLVIKDGRIKAEVRKSVDILKTARVTALRDGLVTNVKISKDTLSITQLKKVGSNTTEVTIKSVVSDRQDSILFASNYPTISFGSDGSLKTDTSVSGTPTITITDGKNEYYVEVKPSGLSHVVPLKTLP